MAPAHRELWPVDELVSRALEALGADAARVAVTLDGDAPLVSVDATQLERVLVNVLENALRFSSAADPVELVVGSTGDDVLVTIVDRGPGLEPDEPRADLRALRARARRRRGNRARPRDRARVCRGERLPAVGRAAPGLGASFTLALPSAAARPTLAR